MELTWLEDFVVLARTRHFSRAAEERHVSQPAFSRRIQALEAWLGTDLIDRRTTPVTLSVEGERFRETAIGVLRDVYRDRDAFRRDFSKMHADIRIAGSTAILVHFVPPWLEAVAERVGPFKTEIGSYGSRYSGTAADMAYSLRRGDIDFTITYAHPDLPWMLDTGNFDWKIIANVAFRPYALADADGKPIYALPGRPEAPLPWLAYAQDSMLARLEGLILQRAKSELSLEIMHQGMAVEVLKQLALRGQGFGWFPEMAVAEEAAAGLLVPAGGKDTETDLELRIYRSRAHTRRIVEEIWEAAEDILDGSA